LLGRVRVAFTCQVQFALIQNSDVTTYCFKLVFDTRGIVCTDVAALLLGHSL
jgi:hypothetical protein